MFELQGSPLVMPFDAPRGRNPMGGKAFFVTDDTHGSDDNEGNDPEFPLATIAEAYGKCTSKKNDYIFVQSTATGVQAKLTIAKWYIHLIGLSNGCWDNGVGMDGVGDPAITLGGDSVGVEIAGLNLGASGGNPAILVTGNYTAHIHHCVFGTIVATIGIHATGDFSHSDVANCFFGDRLTGYGMFLAGDTDTMFVNNLFQLSSHLACYTAGIYVQAGGIAQILQNVFYAKHGGALAGWAITLAAPTHSHIVAGNIAAEDGDTPTANPWKDDTATGVVKLNGWSGNRAGNDCTMPA